MKNKNQMKEGKKRGVIGSVLIGILSLILFLVLLHEQFSPLTCFGVSLFFMLLANGVFSLILHRRSGSAEEKFGRSLGQIMLEIVVKMQFPMVICDMSGKIIWRNRAFGMATEMIGSVMGASIGTISSVDLEALAEDHEISAELCDRRYRIRPFAFKTDEKSYWFLVFDDCTEVDTLTARVESERSVVAFVHVDNLDELSRHGQDDYRSEANDVAAILREFAASLHAILREYDRNKYMLLMNRESLTKCRKSNFDILDKVRDIRVGDLALPITI